MLNQALSFARKRGGSSRLSQNWVLLFLFFMILHFSLSSSARVFNYNDVWVTAYISGSGGYSNLGSDAFEDSSGDSTYFAHKEDVDYNFTGEFGFAFLLGKGAELQLGVMGLKAKTANVNGLNTSGTSLMGIESAVSAFVPMARLSANYFNNGVTRLYMFGGLGYATTKVTNDYEVSAPGVAQYASGTSYSEDWKAISTMYEVGGGVETFVFDNVTFGLFAGWRFFDVTDFEFTNDVAAVRAGSTTNYLSGGKVRDNAGKKLALDLGGSFVGLSIRFYIPPLN